LARRADIGNDWVLTPGEVQSIEVTGTNLTWGRDRIMIVDCTGTCGVSQPAVALSAPDATQSSFNHWVAENFFVDPPHDNEEGPYVAPEQVDMGLAWNVRTNRYCPGNNMDVTQITYAEVNRHQCYNKCVTNACEGDDDCHCEGLMGGYDGPASGALCLDEPACKAVCAGMSDCFGIDMHADRPRCFLNSVEKGEGDQGSCKDYVADDSLTNYDDYNFWYKQAAGQPKRRLGGVQPRQLLAAVDRGSSWGEILRFKGASFQSGGKFKACFCDHETLAGPESVCAKASDYKIEIGMIHVSGVSCLIEDAKFQRGTCVSQHWGGLRCYGSADDVPMLTVPAGEVFGGPLLPEQDDIEADDAHMSTWCLYGPEEETRDDPACDWPQ